MGEGRVRPSQGPNDGPIGIGPKKKKEEEEGYLKINPEELCPFNDNENGDAEVKPFCL